MKKSFSSLVLEALGTSTCTAPEIVSLVSGGKNDGEYEDRVKKCIANLRHQRRLNSVGMRDGYAVYAAAISPLPPADGKRAAPEPEDDGFDVLHYGVLDDGRLISIHGREFKYYTPEQTAQIRFALGMSITVSSTPLGVPHE